MDLGPHASFICAAYGATGAVLAALGAWLVLDGRRLKRLLGELDARGVRRRSDVRDVRRRDAPRERS
jgi:heme exporter protein D